VRRDGVVDAADGRIAASAGGVIALSVTVVLMVRHDDALALLDGPAPAVVPALGAGGMFAIAGVLFDGGLLVTATRPRAGAV
jgi:hypothetical protein